MSVISDPQTRSTAYPSVAWRDWNLVVLAGLHAYSAAIGWQAQAVSYPLYRSVGADEFLDYHAAYGRSIPLVVVIPGFLTFLGAIGYLWTKPAEVTTREAGVVAGAGLASLLSTVLWAIPRHDDLNRIGQDAGTIDSLLRANSLCVAALTVGAVALGRRVGKLLQQRSSLHV
jgi:hypothetical protein